MVYSSSYSEIESQILKVLETCGQGGKIGVDDATLKSQLPESVSETDRTHALNQLMAKSRVIF